MKTITLFLLFLVVIATQSCSTQNLFQVGETPPTLPADSLTLEKEHLHRLGPDDKVSVSIWNHNDLSVGSIFGIYNSNEVYGKWVMVRQNGEVTLPKIGNVKIGGLTTEEAAERLQKSYSKFIVDPIIVVKVLNREVTVLGEVLTPGTYLLEKEENTLFEMIGMAGGLDFYAEKRKVKLIRKGKEYLLDLTNMDEFEANNITLHSGDIVYIPTRKGKILDKKAPTLIPFAGAITTIAVIISMFSNS